MASLAMILEPRALWGSAPPEPRSRESNWPTLLFSWWATAFAACVILVRLNGRKVRSGRLFREDWIMIWALMPLFVRMILIHFVLIWGTNNIQTDGYTFTDDDLYHRSIGARLVLAARIFYAMFIWLSKWTVSEFLKRMTISLWRKSYEITLQCLRGFLVLTFIVVVIATLTECQPFDHYWQVIPDPGPQCRQGFAQLLSMGTADIITDILLICFPIPIVLRSGQPWPRKLLLTVLFSTSAVLIIITAFRMPEVIMAAGRQQYRTVWASSEILASAFVSNFIIIGSFLRDKGTKKNKYRHNSVSDSIERSVSRRPTLVQLQSLGSDEELFRTLGCRLPDHLQSPKEPALPRPAGVVTTTMTSPYPPEALEAVEDDSYSATSSDDSLRKPPRQGILPSPTPSVTKRSVSFFDVGGLVEDGRQRSLDTRSQGSSTLVTSVAGSYTATHDWVAPSPSQTRRGSRQDTLTSSTLAANRIEADIEGRRSSPQPPSFGNSTDLPSSLPPQTLHRQGTDLSFQDAGGLLSSSTSTSGPRHAPRLGELQDIGGLLGSDDRPMDASAAALQRRLAQARTPQGQQRTAPSRSAPPDSSPDDSQGSALSLSDPGGLLK